MDSEGPSVPWSRIEGALPTLRHAQGGHSDALRGFITLDDENIFVKIGVSDSTKAWAAKEIKAYRFLKGKNFPYIPRVLATNDDATGFALEALCSRDGWDWSDTWSHERLNATLEATDALAKIKPDASYADLVADPLTLRDHSWEILFESDELQKNLIAKLEESQAEELMTGMPQHVERSKRFEHRTDQLVHFDIRADNCSWNAATGQVRLVDWNWIQLGDRRIDTAAILVHVHGSGFNVLPEYADRLDADALHWLAGFWFAAASRPIWPGGPAKLRDGQLRSALIALELSEKIT